MAGVVGESLGERGPLVVLATRRGGSPPGGSASQVDGDHPAPTPDEHVDGRGADPRRGTRDDVPSDPPATPSATSPSRTRHPRAPMVSRTTSPVMRGITNGDVRAGPGSVGSIGIPLEEERMARHTRRFGVLARPVAAVLLRRTGGDRHRCDVGHRPRVGRGARRRGRAGARRRPRPTATRSAWLHRCGTPGSTSPASPAMSPPTAASDAIVAPPSTDGGASTPSSPTPAPRSTSPARRTSTRSTCMFALHVRSVVGARERRHAGHRRVRRRRVRRHVEPRGAARQPRALGVRRHEGGQRAARAQPRRAVGSPRRARERHLTGRDRDRVRPTDHRRPVDSAIRRDRTPLRRFGRVEEVAGAVVWLASSAGGFVTGQNIVIDGGTLIAD